MTYVISEIGINHNGDMELAKELILKSKESGCDAVKFQKREPDACVPEKQKSVRRMTPWGEMSYLEYKYRIEFGKKEYDEIEQALESDTPENDLAARINNGGGPL